MMPVAKPRVMLVEDNPAHARLLILPLNRRGVEVDWAHDGEEAVGRLTSVDDVPQHASLVLLDLRLPGLSGFDVLDQVRRQGRSRHIPIIILSTSAEAADISEAYRRGANAYLVKPLDIDELERVVSSVVDFWLMHNQATSSRRG